MSRPASYARPGEDDPSLATVNMILYSHPGEGKTVLWGTGGKDVLFMVSDPEGIISARALGHTPHSVQVTDYEELQEVYEWLKEDKPRDFKWVVWDSLTLFQDRALQDDIMVDAVNDNPNQDEFVPDRRQYFQSMNRIGRYIRNFVDLPYNFGASCHVMPTDDKSDNNQGTIMMPYIAGKGVAVKVSGYMNVIGYLHKAPSVADPQKVVQTVEFMKHNKYYAKDRFNALGKSMERPTLPKIDAAITKWRLEHKPKPTTATTAKGK